MICETRYTFPKVGSENLKEVLLHVCKITKSDEEYDNFILSKLN